MKRGGSRQYHVRRPAEIREATLTAAVSMGCWPLMRRLTLLMIALPFLGTACTTA